MLQRLYDAGTIGDVGDVVPVALWGLSVNHSPCTPGTYLDEPVKAVARSPLGSISAVFNLNEQLSHLVKPP